MVIDKEIPAGLLNISRAIQEAGGCAYLVGGWVRDSLLDQDSKDYDLEVYGLGGEKLQQLLSEFGKVSTVGKAFGILLMKMDGMQLDIALPRTESKIGSGHKGFEVETDPHLTFAEASSRRDFTINAMGVRLPEMELEDPHGGQQDLANRILRHVGPAFGEDPLRALRGTQFAARFNLSIPPETLQICSEQDISELSTERFEEEFRKLLLKAEKPSIGLQALKDMNLDRFFPELTRESNPLSWEDRKQILDRAVCYRQDAAEEKNELLFMLSALCAGMTSQEAHHFGERISRDRLIIETSAKRAPMIPAVLQHAKLGLMDRPWVRRLALEESIPEVIRLCRAWYEGKHSVNLWEPATELQSLAHQAEVYNAKPKCWLQGRDLIQMGVQPGPQMGEIIKKAFEMQIEEEFHSRDEALIWAKKTLNIQK